MDSLCSIGDVVYQSNYCISLSIKFCNKIIILIVTEASSALANVTKLEAQRSK